MDIILLKSGAAWILNTETSRCKNEQEARESIYNWSHAESKEEFVFSKTFEENNRLGKLLQSIREFDSDDYFVDDLKDFLWEVFKAGEKHGLRLAAERIEKVIMNNENIKTKGDE